MSVVRTSLLPGMLLVAALVAPDSCRAVVPFDQFLIHLTSRPSTQSQWPVDVVVKPNGIPYVIYTRGPSTIGGSGDVLYRASWITDPTGGGWSNTFYANWHNSTLVDPVGAFTADGEFEVAVIARSSGAGPYYIPNGMIGYGNRLRDSYWSWRSSLAVDGSNRRHLAYYEDWDVAFHATHKLYYGFSDDGVTWTVDDVATELENPSLAEHGGTVFIAVRPKTLPPRGIKLLEKLGEGVWSSTVVDAAYDPTSLALAMDSGGNAHIVFTTDTGLVRYGTNASGSWVFDTRYAAGISTGADIALDETDGIHISFANSNGNIYYAGGTTLDIAVDSGIVGLETSIAVSLGDIHIAYADTSRLVRHAWSRDCNRNDVRDSLDIANGTSLDCNYNGFPDECDLQRGFSEDCNGNGVPDECDISAATSLDCNGNGVPDGCDISSGTSEDCNNNLIPDDCEPDCNNNGIPDWCDVWYGGFADCNDNIIPDECEPEGEDCNGNGIPDLCEIEAGTTTDCDLNGVPDSCDVANGAIDCDNNGIQDLCDFGTHLVISGPGGAYDEFGTSLARGDINGDGLEDLIVGGPYSGSGRDEGRVYVYYGGTPMDDVADLVLAGSTSGAALHFGYDVACGDVNNDGYDDVIVGAPIGSTLLAPDRGFVFVFLGGASPSTTYAVRIDGSTYEHLGYAVASADINGDNYDDVIAGTNPDGLLAPAEKVEIYLGNALGSGPYQTFLGEGSNDQFGASVANAGDVDGNGVEDLIVGASENNYGEGKAYLYLGLLGSTMTTGPTFTEGGNFYRFGTALGGGSDINDDGFDDVLITDDGSKSLWVYMGGSTPDGSVDFFVEHTTNSGASGPWHSLSSLADVDGDGFPDILLGTPSDKGAIEFFSGTARVFLGGSSVGSDHVRIFVGEDAFQGFLGGAVLGFDDMNGDGLDEFVVGEPGYGDTQGRVHVLDMLHTELCNQIGVPTILEAQFALRAHPSPFSHRTNLMFSLPEPGDVFLQVFDASGQLVSEFARAPYPAGTSYVIWDGRSQGRTLPNGIYFGRLSLGSRVASTKMVLLR